MAYTPGKYSSISKKRFISLAPSYWIAITFFQIYAIISNAFNSEMFVNICTEPIDVILNFLLLHGFSPKDFNRVIPGGWYISTQWMLYLLFPCLVRKFEKLKQAGRNTIVIPLSTFFISLGVQILIAFFHGNPELSNLNTFLHYSVINQMPCFALGIYMYYLLNDENRVLKSNRSYLNLSLAVGFLSSVLFYFLRNVPFIFVVVPVLYAVAFFYFILYLETLDESCRIRKFFNCFKKFGEISFAAYYMNVICVMLIPFYIIKLMPTVNGNVMFIILFIMGYPATYYFSIIYDKVIKKTQKWCVKKFL